MIGRGTTGRPCQKVYDEDWDIFKIIENVSQCGEFLVVVRLKR